VNPDGHNTIRHPGAYQHVLKKISEQRASSAMTRDWLICSDSPAAMAEWNAEYAERFGAELSERAGKPVRVQGWMLPPGLPPPFEQFPRGGGGRRSFVVDPTDTITLRQFAAF
jgi:hypothetical protein